jgi:hypothetical protein
MKKFVIAALSLTPAIVLAQGNNPSLGGLHRLLDSISNLVQTALPVVVGIGLLVFMWGLVRFIFAGAEGKEEGKSLMIWGIVALFVMVSVWGIVRFIGNALDIRQGETITPPTVERL